MSNGFMTTEQSTIAHDFVDFLNKSVTPYHAVEECAKRLKAQNFVELKESESWEIEPSKKYFVTKNRTTIFAFAVGGRYRPGNGYSIIAAHTDSPSLRLKPISRITNDMFMQVGVSTYGGGLWRTWFDRDLSLAGQVTYLDGHKISQKLVNLFGPVLFIPNLAIHLSSETDRKNFEFNAEANLRPILATLFAEKSACENETIPESAEGTVGYLTKNHHNVLLKRIAEQIGCEIERILDLDLYLYDSQIATIGGMYNEFISGQRLDNLLGTYSCISGLITSLCTLDSDENIRLAACFDNEECGSGSAQGADSAFIEWVLRRLSCGGSPVAFEEAVAKSMIVSFDQAHCTHPNYTNKHEEQHKPELHGGVVVKVNYNQRYATSSATHSIIRYIARCASLPLQTFVVRNDMPCGSTVGPILSAKLGIRTIDVGCTQLAMHSIRELMGSSSPQQALKLCEAYYSLLRESLSSLL